MKTILLGKALRMTDAHHPSVIQKKGDVCGENTAKCKQDSSLYS